MTNLRKIEQFINDIDNNMNKSIFKSYIYSRLDKKNEGKILNSNYKKLFSKFKDVNIYELSMDEIVRLIWSEEFDARTINSFMKYLYKNDLCQEMIINKRAFKFMNAPISQDYIILLRNDPSVLSRTVYGYSTLESKYGVLKKVLEFGNEYISTVLTSFFENTHLRFDTIFSERISKFLILNYPSFTIESINDTLFDGFFFENLDMKKEEFWTARKFVNWIEWELKVNCKLNIQCDYFKLARNDNFVSSIFGRYEVQAGKPYFAEENSLYKNLIRKIELIHYSETKENCKIFLECNYRSKGFNSVISDFSYYKKLFSCLADINTECMDEEDVKKIFSYKTNKTHIRNSFLKFIYEEGKCQLFENNKRAYFFLKMPLKTKYIQEYINDSSVVHRIIYGRRSNGNNESKIMPAGNEYFSNLLTSFCVSTQAKLVGNDFSERLSFYFWNKKFGDIYDINQDENIEEFFIENIDMAYQSFTFCKEFFLWIKQMIVENGNVDSCKSYTTSLLQYNNFRDYFSLGYRPINYNRHEVIPVIDDWFVLPSSENNYSTKNTHNTILAVSFSKINNNKLRQLSKEFYWHRTTAINHRTNEIRVITEFCNSITIRVDKLSITRKDCAAYNNYLRIKYNSRETIDSILNVIRAFLRFIADKNSEFVESDCEYFLTSGFRKIKNEVKTISEEHLELLAQYFDKKKNNSLVDLTNYTIFHICLNTEFRISQILNLKINCVKESFKKGEYIIISPTKVTAGQIIEQPCAKVLKRIIDLHLEATANIREKIMDEEIKKYLFVVPRMKYMYARIENSRFQKQMSYACNQLGIPAYGPSNLRKTYITNAKRYIKEHGLSDILLLGITNHKSINTVYKHYVQTDIREALEATNNIIIGDFQISGKIYDTSNNISKTNSVEDNCGYCMSTDCIKNGVYSCLLCESFATTLDNLPFFESKISVISEKIQMEDDQHDKEDLINIKRLYVKYLEQLITLKEKSNGNHE